MYSADSKAGHNCFTGNMFKSFHENNIKTKKACYRQLNLSLIQTCVSKIHGCDWHRAEGTPCCNSTPSTVTSRAEPRSSMSWRGSCVSSFFQSLQLWMNPRVKEASKQISGSLKGLDMVPAQHTIARAWKSSNSQCSQQTASNTYARVTAFLRSCVAHGRNGSFQEKKKCRCCYSKWDQRELSSI